MLIRILELCRKIADEISAGAGPRVTTTVAVRVALETKQLG
jgi:hypothetical protein